MFLRNPNSRGQKLRARYAYYRHVWRPQHTDIRLLLAMVWLPWFIIERLHRKRKLQDLRRGFVNSDAVSGALRSRALF